MDYILSQQDRFGNQHYYEYFFFKDLEGKYKKKRTSKYTIDENLKKITHKKKNESFDYSMMSKVKVLFLKDNDCSIVKSNISKMNGFLKKIKHLDYKLYKGVMNFQKLIQSEKGVSFFKETAHLSDQDIVKVQKNTNEVADYFKKSCLSGDIKFDLKFSTYFDNSTYDHSSFNCELPL